MTHLPPPTGPVLQDAPASDADDGFPTHPRQRPIIAATILAGVPVIPTLWIMRPRGPDSHYITQPDARSPISRSCSCVIFGYFSARRAAHLDPIQALHYE